MIACSHTFYAISVLCLPESWFRTHQMMCIVKGEVDLLNNIYFIVKK